MIIVQKKTALKLDVK